MIANNPYLRETSFMILDAPRLYLQSLSDTKFHKMEGNSGVVYKIDLINFTCTCPDWVEGRVRFSFPDIRRACKHIARFLSSGPTILLPIPACDYRLGAFSIENRKLFLIQKENNRWIDVYYQTEHGGYTSHGFCMLERRWANREPPPNTVLIKQIIRSWLKTEEPQPWNGELPPLPSTAVESIRKREEAQEAEYQRFEEAKLGCFVCLLKLQFPPGPPECIQIICPQCGITNVLTKSGRTNRPERLAIYKKYDGDLYTKKVEGLIKTSPPEMRGELERLKEAELKPLLKQEKELKNQFY